MLIVIEILKETFNTLLNGQISLLSHMNITLALRFSTISSRRS
jgi:hypothetical protein